MYSVTFSPDGAVTLWEEFHTALNAPGEDAWVAGTPTGSLFWRNTLVVRRMHRDPARTFLRFGLPRGLPLKTVRPELTSSRLVAFPKALLSGSKSSAGGRFPGRVLVYELEL